MDVSFLRFLAATSSVFLSSLDESSCRFSYSILMCLLGSFWFVDKAAIASLAAERVCLPFEVKYGEALILEIRENKLIICLNRQSPLHLPLPVLLWTVLPVLAMERWFWRESDVTRPADYVISHHIKAGDLPKNKTDSLLAHPLHWIFSTLNPKEQRIGINKRMENLQSLVWHQISSNEILLKILSLRSVHD